MMPTDPASPYPAPAVDAVPMDISCSVCHKKDETVRMVTYPFVISVVFATFQRAFRGTWCKRHRRKWQLLASIITAVLGWVGIPFGFFFTPIALFKLARGGVQDPKMNCALLQALAESNLQAGNKETAVRCLEASLRFADDPAVRTRLAQLQIGLVSTPTEERSMPRWLAILLGLLGAAAIGTAVGVLDYATSFLLSFITAEITSIFVVILTWTPLVLFVFLGSLFLADLVEWALTRARVRNGFLAVIFGLVAALLAVYGILQGDALSDFAAYVILGGTFASPDQAILTLLLTIFAGGFFWLAGTAAITETFAIIYLCILGVGAIYYLIAAISAATQTARWQSRLPAAQGSN